MEKPNGSIDTTTTPNKEELPNNDLKYDGWKGANRK